MNRVLLFVVPLLVATASLEAQDEPRAGRSPLVVLLSRNPWGEVMGADSPRFALYDDGLVIFRRVSKDGETAEHVSTVLSDADKVAFVTSLGIGKTFHDLEERYEVSEATCQRTHALHVWDHGERKTVSVCGSLTKKPDPDHRADRSNTPPEFLRIYDALIAYDKEDAKTWLPEKIEVMVWGFEYSKDDAFVWPSDWPDLKHPETKKRGDDDYSVMLPSSKFEALKTLLQGRRQTQALLMNEKKWAVSYRFPFPKEDAWAR